MEVKIEDLTKEYNDNGQNKDSQPSVVIVKYYYKSHVQIAWDKSHLFSGAFKWIHLVM